MQDYILFLQLHTLSTEDDHGEVTVLSVHPADPEIIAVGYVAIATLALLS